MTSKQNINENGEVDGESVSYYKDGQLESKGNYANGKRSGYWELYWYTGKLRSKGNYKKGKFDGEWSEYIEGNICLVKTYRDGILEGECKSFYTNGQLNWKGLYKKDKKEGEWEYYDIHGNINEKGSYLNGSRYGIWEEEGQMVNHYNDDGKRIITESEKQEYLRQENLIEQKSAGVQNFFIKYVVIAILLIGLVIFLLLK